MKRIIKYYSTLIIVLVTILLSSCRALRMPEITAEDGLYRGLDLSDTTNLGQVPWRELFTDQDLQQLIDKAINNNPDVQIASARIQKAQAAFRQSAAEFFPSLNAGTNAQYQSKNEGQGLPELYQIFGSTSWEADIFGRLRSARKASLASLLASKAYKRAVQTNLVASVAMNYYTLLALDSQLEITRQTLGKRIRNAETMQVMKDNDVITGADLVLSQASRYSAEVSIPDLEQRIFETENTLSLLTGENPGPIKRSTLDEQSITTDLKTGIPVQLLSNRPDVLQAEYQLRSYFELIKVARRNFYPSINITGRGGLSQTSIDALFNAPVFFWSITGAFVQPIFNYGLNMQRYRSANADFMESQATFRQTLLNAGAEVTDALHSYQSATDKISIRGKQIEYLEKAVDYTTELLKYTSTTSYIDVLTSEVNLLAAQLAGVNDRLQQLQSVVQLYQSLGGGWK